ncbi:MAG: type II secretion system F family protein [Sedimentisphaerales bacterium]
MSAIEPDLVSGKRVSGRPRSCLRQEDAGAESGERADEIKEAYKKEIVARVGTREICRVASQLATLLRAGMPLVPALSALVEQLQSAPKHKLIRLGAEQDPLTQILAQVRDNVNAGSTLADALGKYPNVFSPLIVNMVAAGETSGTLEEVLLRLAQMLEKRLQLISRVKSAIAYPLMMIVVAVAVVVFLLSYVVPSITQIFLEMNQTLPIPTRLLISISSFMKTYLVLIAIVVAGVFLAVGAALRTREGKLFADRAKLKLPLFGRLFVKLEIAWLTRTWAMLLASGIPVVGALQIARGVTQNSFIVNALDRIKDSVSRGDSIADAIKTAGFFPPVVFHIVSTSETSANLEAGLIDIAEMYDSEVEMTAKTLTSLLEPAILLVMGAVIGFIVLAILLPIFEINQML